MTMTSRSFLSVAKYSLICALLLLPCILPSYALQRSLKDDDKDDKDAKEDVPLIIPSAGITPSFKDNNDLESEGPCEAAIESACKGIDEGSGKIAKCISQRLDSERKGNVAGNLVTGECLKELNEYNEDVTGSINKAPELARACKDDVEKFCSDKSDAKEAGSVVSCLREKKAKLGATCKAKVTQLQKESSLNVKLDPKLASACKEDLKKYCADVETGRGNELDCLTSQKELSFNCKQEVSRSQEESSDDFRLSGNLFDKCYNDYQKFCKDVEPGQNRVQDCLEDHRDESEFSASCKEAIEDVVAKRVSNFKLDSGLRSACEDDLVQLCGITLKEIDKDKDTKQKAVNCLQDRRDALHSERCKKEVRRTIERASRDIRFDEVLAKACTVDRKQYCNDIQPGSARVIRCLQDHRDNLQPQCAAAMFDHEVRMAEDIDFKYPMKKACSWEINTFCEGVPHGHARIIRCLEQHLDHIDMSKECKAEITKDQNRRAGDFRLNWRLQHSCQEDIDHLCRGLCDSSLPCGGMVLQCLEEHQDNITNAECQEEVFYYQLMEVTDFRNDVILAEACREDVKTYCKDVEPGEGRVHQCLRYNRDHISQKCRQEEMKLAALEYKDIRLRPKLNKLCSEERAVFCKNVKPGKSRVMKCLIENMAQPNFGEECKGQLEEREKAMKDNVRFDAAVASECAEEVDTLCAEKKNGLRANSSVLLCLMSNWREASESETCSKELSRAVRLALWNYRKGDQLTSVCDEDVDRECHQNAVARAANPFTIGAVGRCLSKALVSNKRLSPACKDVVLIAAPRDYRNLYDAPMDVNPMLAKLTQIQQATGMDEVFVDQHSAITVTGWVALVCMLSIIIVGVGGFYLLYRRFIIGADKPHTLHVKMGDA